MKINLQFFLVGLTIVLCHFNSPVQAQEKPLGQKDSIYSTILKEQRVIQVVLPDKYKAVSSQKYDVIYVLDGESNTNLVSHIQHFLENENTLPPLMIVGIHNTDRARDFTPTNSNNIASSGGAEKFLSFLKNELIPYVNKTYPSSGDNILCGHSLGGLFNMYAFINEPKLFEGHIAIDPSFWWDTRYMNKLAKKKLDDSYSLNKTIFVSGREGGGYADMGIESMDSIVKSKSLAGLNWKSVAYADETHGSIRLKTIYDGLKFCYQGYGNQEIVFHPMNGTVLKDKPIKIWCFSDLKTLRYTTDGTEPSASSSKMEKEITLSSPGKLNLKALTTKSKYDKVVIGDFKSGKVLPPVLKPKNALPGGFHYSYYEGKWDSLPDFRKLKSISTGTTNKEFNLQKLSCKTNFGCVIDGYIEIKEEGYHIFGLDSDDGAKLFLGDQLLIEYDGLHGMGKARSYILPLQKGFYPLKVEYFQKEGGSGLELVYLTPGKMEPKPIPFDIQYSKK